MIDNGLSEDVPPDDDTLGPIYHEKVPLISSYGTTSGAHWIRNLVDLSKAISSALNYEPDHEACNFLTSNTRPVFDDEPDIDLSLYEYSPLPATGWIRLLRFTIHTIEDNVGDGEDALESEIDECSPDDLQCEINEYPLDAAETLGYKALSYAWGHPYRTHHVICNDARIPITANLADWFRHCEPGVHLFWIDAVCINQTDKQERAAQVEQMRDVYRNAYGVIAWVGSTVLPWDAGLPAPNIDLSDLMETLSDVRAMTALASFETDFKVDQVGLRNILFHASLRLVWAYLRIQVEKFRGSLRMLYDSIFPPSESQIQKKHELFTYTWHYTSKRHMHDLAEHPLLTLFRRSYFSRRWVCAFSLCSLRGTSKMAQM